jgi:hypothetical protein
LKDLLFDIETLGVISSESVVTSIGVVAFDMNKLTSYEELVAAGFYVKLDVKNQIKNYGRTIQKDTIEWWAKQSKEARKECLPSPNDAELVPALTMLNDWVESIPGFRKKDAYALSQGSQFDFPKIESLYADAEMQVPFTTWKIRDLRSINDVLTGLRTGTYKIPEPEGFILHNALHDAAFAAYKLQHLMHSLTQVEN